MIIKPELLHKGDVIGIVSPSHVASVEEYEEIMSRIENMGFHAKAGKNLYKDTYGYIAAENERADDFNEMVNDPAVKMVFFGGGEGSIDLLPLIDYAAVRKQPKIYVSYSDGTSILNSIYNKTGLMTYYGQTPGLLKDLRHYDYMQFAAHFLDGNVTSFTRNSKWHILNPGVCRGRLTGGYLLNYALLLNSPFFNYGNAEKYILFLEDYEQFNDIGTVSMLISHIEQSDFADHISGLLFGHYSESIHPELMERLKRFGVKHDVPVVYCDDFGHGNNHAILPIGCDAALDTGKCELLFIG